MVKVEVIDMVENTKVVNLEVTGVPSGDHEASCIDVSQEEFERLNGFKPDEFDESRFYKNLFRYYGVEIPNKYIEEFGRNAILKLKVTYEIEKVGEAEEK